MLPAVPADELARRLQLTYPGGAADTQLEAAVDVAQAMLTGHVDETLVAGNVGLWVEAVTQLAVKVWDTGNKGTSGLDFNGDWTMPTVSASAGMVNGVAALWQPLALTGGAVIA